VSNRVKWGVDVVEDAEFWFTGAPQLLWAHNLGRHRLPGDQTGKLFAVDLGNRVEVLHLSFDILLGPVKPEAPTCASVNAQRSADSISIKTDGDFAFEVAADCVRC
jgi:hypothetical protein